MRRWVGRAAVAVAIGVGSLIVGASAASAHALAVSSDPPAGATLAQAPKAVTITFSETPDPRHSGIQVLDTSGAAHQVGRAHTVAGQPQALSVAVGALTKGVYTVQWETVSKVDGHYATGSFAFGVGVTPTGTAAGAGVVRSPPVSPWAVVTRWLIYAGLMGLVGTAFVGLLAGASGRLVGLADVSWGLAAGGVLGLAQQQRTGDHISIGQFWGSSLGHQFAYRGAPLAVAGLALLAGWRLAPRPIALPVAGLAGLASMLGDVESSHAAGERSWTWFHVGTQWLHFAAAGVWLGGLVAVVATIHRLEAEPRRRLASRFSNAALASVVVIAGTGLLRGLDEIRTWNGLFSTTFGRWAIVKISLLAALICVGLFQRRRGVPSALKSTGATLRRLGTVELAGATVILVAAGFLQSLAPPSITSRAKPPAPIVVTGHDFATTVSLRLQVSPGTPGFNRFTLRVLDYDSHRPVNGSTVTLTFNLPSDPDLGPSTLTLPPSGAGTYSAVAPNLSVAGTWTVTALVQEGSQSAEVPLSITTRTVPVRVDKVENPGLPTTYTIHATPTVSIQVYLDPGRAGPLNEFHVTLIAADGNEEPATHASVTASVGNSVPTALTVRRLDTIGHFVADLLNATATNYHFTIDATTDQGPVHAEITIPVT